MAVTIRDVARAAGCSVKTVSRVINGEPNVTPEMRARVQAAVVKTGFTPNVAARHLASRRTYVLCVLMVPGVYQQDSAGLGRVMNAASERGYRIIFQPYVPSLRRSRAQLFDMLAQHSVDGFISTPPCDADGFVQDLATTYKTPLVQVDPARDSQFPSVSAAHSAGARAAVEHLIALGHRRIAFLAGPPGLRASAERLAGYRRALLDHALPLCPEWIENAEFTFEGGRRAARRLFSLPQPPTAVLGGSDLSALGALFALQELGLRVPDQVSVCGFDDIPAAALVYPGLTTVSQSSSVLLEAALLLLVARLTKAQPPDHHLTIPIHLVLRGSTGPAAGEVTTDGHG